MELRPLELVKGSAGKSPASPPIGVQARLSVNESL